jgi:hypothetical protein
VFGGPVGRRRLLIGWRSLWWAIGQQSLYRTLAPLTPHNILLQLQVSEDKTVNATKLADVGIGEEKQIARKIKDEDCFNAESKVSHRL